MNRLAAITRAISAGVFLFGCSLNILAIDMNAVEAELSGPVTVLLDSGSRQTGMVKYWNGENLRLEIQLGAGSAEMTVSAEEIEDIVFPGKDYLLLLDEYMTDPAMVEESLTLFRAFYKQRGAYLQFMDPSELNLFVEYVRYALEQNKPLRAVAIIEVLRPFINDETLLETLDDSALLAFFLGGLKKEAEEQALQWIEAAVPAHRSALGWRILSEIHFEDEKYEEAFWTALYPVAFANQMPIKHLNECYAFAIAAARKSRQPELQERLTLEMAELELPWPDAIDALSEFKPEPVAAKVEPEVKAEEQQLIDELGPIQSPSPLDPLESLPTRILPQRTEGSNTPQ